MDVIAAPESDECEAVTLHDWLGDRRPFHLSTNSGSELVAFQSWRNFKEALAFAARKTDRHLSTTVCYSAGTSIEPKAVVGSTLTNGRIWEAEK